MRLSHLLAFLALAAAPSPGAAQSAAPAAWGLFSARYDTRTSDFIYAVYGYGRLFGMVGALDNPRSGYTELLAAAGLNFSIAGGPTQSLAVGGARVGDAWYGQVYYLPAAHAGRMWFRATAELYLPMRGTHSTQFALSPVSATIAFGRWVEAGAALDLSSASGEKTVTALGPELRLALPKATLGMDLQRSLDGGSGRARVFFTTTP